MKRRGFFQSLVKAAAIVALAPQLAFRAQRIPFEMDTEYRCVMTAPTRHMSLVSTTLTVMYEDPSKHMVIQNFSD